MRDIIFRGKRLKDGKWLYGSLLKTKNGKYQINGCNFNSSVDIDTVGEWTGIYDKFGFRVFEGDIVNSYRYKWAGGICSVAVYPCEIKFYEGKFIMVDTKSNRVYALDKDIEVVGNIYDR